MAGSQRGSNRFPESLILGLIEALSPIPPWVRYVFLCPEAHVPPGHILLLCLCDPGHLPEIHQDLARRKYPEKILFGWGDVGDYIPEDSVLFYRKK